MIFSFSSTFRFNNTFSLNRIVLWTCLNFVIIKSGFLTVNIISGVICEALHPSLFNFSSSPYSLNEIAFLPSLSCADVIPHEKCIFHSMKITWAHRRAKTVTVWIDYGRNNDLFRWGNALNMMMIWLVVHAKRITKDYCDLFWSRAKAWWCLLWRALIRSFSLKFSFA